MRVDSCKFMGRPPNYRLSAGEPGANSKPSCLDCKFVTDNRCHAYCVRFSSRVNPWFVCDDWQHR